MYLEIYLTLRHAFQKAASRVVNVVDIALKVGKRAQPVKVSDDVADRAAQAIFPGVIATVGRRAIRFDILGRHGWTNENEIVVEVMAMENLRRDRIEEGFGQLGLFVVEQQPDVEQFDLLPGRLVDLAGIEITVQPPRHIRRRGRRRTGCAP